MIHKTTDHTHPHARKGLSQRFFAKFFAGAQGEGDPDFYDAVVRDYKHWLFDNLSGTVVEIGPGTGSNFSYMPSGIHWVGIEPNVFMHDHLLKAAEKRGIRGELRTGIVEQLELPDSSADAVISTLVLCSVSSQDTAIKEIMRVLKPGGCLVFVEHVAAPNGSFLRLMQKIIKPLWWTVADGCHPDRDTASVLQQAGFSSLEVKTFRAPLMLASPHIAGKAVK